MRLDVIIKKGNHLAITSQSTICTGNECIFRESSVLDKQISYCAFYLLHQKYKYYRKINKINHHGKIEPCQIE